MTNQISALFFVVFAALIGVTALVLIEKAGGGAGESRQGSLAAAFNEMLSQYAGSGSRPTQAENTGSGAQSAPAENSGTSSAAVSENSEGTSSEASSQETRREPASILMTFVGDCTLGTDEYFYYGTSFNAYYDEYGPDYFLELVRPLFEGDDLTVVNMEGTLTNEPERQIGKEFCFKGPPEFVEILAESSVEAANMANNHSYDYGEKSYTDTLEILEERGISTFGYDRTAVVEVKGMKVGFFGLMELFEPAEDLVPLTEALIASLRAQGAELIVAVYHWGYELMRPPHADQVMLGHMAIDAGADIVIGHHPHIVQGIELYKGKLIAYSLGNFCFGGNDGAGEMDTMILQVTFLVEEAAPGSGTEAQSGAEDGSAPEEGIVVTTAGLEVFPCLFTSEDWHNNYQPSILEGEAADETLSLIRRRSELVLETLWELGEAGEEIAVYDPVAQAFIPTGE